MITDPKKKSKKGSKDARRHRDKQKQVIREKLPEIIADESIITKKKNKKVKIPIKSIEIPRFKPSSKDKGGSGIGQGKAGKGDIIDTRPAPGSGSGSSGRGGNEPGEDFIETEVEIEELIEMMMDDLGLPNLQEKNVKELEIEMGFKFSSIVKQGPSSLLRTKETVQQGFKNFFGFMNVLKQKGYDEFLSFQALKQAKGNLKRTIELLENPSDIAVEADEIKPFPIFTSEDDYRYLKVDKNVSYSSRAVVIAMMDVSGSMGVMKKYIARSMLYWLVEFLRRIYGQVEVRFITHHTEAKIVSEENFFRTMESGGTMCYSAYNLSLDLIKKNYPISSWNVYCWHFSDGDDWDASISADVLQKLLNSGINMFGYGEILSGGNSDLTKELLDRLDYENKKENGIEVIRGKTVPFLGTVIKRKEDIFPALKIFLNKDRRWN